MKKLLLLTAIIASPVAAEDRFESIRQIWPVCASCHGAQGQGVGAMPALAGRDAAYIITALLQYKNKEQRGPLSSLMWQQASMLEDGDIGTLGVFVEQEL